MNFPFPRGMSVLLAALLFIAATGFLVAKPAKERNIADTIYANPILTDFAKMLQASPDLYTFLSGKGPFTVFVPTDSAFAKLKPSELDALLRPENADRRNAILLFHVINGKRLTMKDLTSLHAVFSNQGNPLTFKLTHTGVYLVQKTKVTHADIRCGNGYINEVDTVLTPPEIALPPLKAAPVAAPVAADQNVVTVPAVTNINAIPIVVPVIGEGAPAITNAPPVSPAPH